MNTTERPIYQIPVNNLRDLQTKLDEMNRRAVRLGCEPIALQFGEEFDVERHCERTGIKYKVKYVKVEVTGETPKLNGWKLMASIEKQESGENLVRCVPGETVPESYRTTDAHCDHCRSDRRRKEVFILKHDDGRFAQVGRQCIADFLGHQSVENICGRASWLFSFSEEMNDACDEDYGSRVEITLPIERFVAATAICVRRLGWLSKSKAAEMGEGGPMSTAGIAWTICTDPHKSVQELIEKENLHAEERDMEIATEAIAWARGLSVSGADDYLYNLGVACRLESVTYRTSGIVASVVAAYLREQDRINELGMKAKRTPGVHVGVVGERQGFTVTVQSLKYIESVYGVKTLCRFEDKAGNVLIWWCSGDSDWLKEGETIDITGTVKKHGDYKGWLQTELSRVASGLPKAKKARKAKIAPAPVLDSQPCPF